MLGLTRAGILSLVIVLAMLWHGWSKAGHIIIMVIPPLALIWFPQVIDEYTFGSWYKGNRIDVHTPAFLLEAVGWMLLLLEAGVVFHARGTLHPVS